ncbi:GntP family permease [Nocardioides panacis]|uniref:GntP family permease n=1 Tax=Nocardioides panacis TaxID=2849501 RepID=A0A975SWY1_9ACTN|nr:SLC13 family permease [Nocardioides panacis]QWZ07351.1 GntP family permease [Nocardioides panacis]
MSALLSATAAVRPRLLSLVEDPPTLTHAGNTQIVLAAVLGIAAVVVLIVWVKMHPFLALMLGTAVMGIVAGVAPLDIITSFTTGFGGTVGAVGLLIGLGAMLGALLADSGGADTIVDTIIGKVGKRGLPWAMALIAAILGLPLFFEVGVVLLVPVVILVARRTDVPLMRVGIPALAGLSILHGLVPPHPGPLVAIDALGADLGLTLLFGLIVAVPTLVLCGPLLARFVEQWVPLHASDEAVARVTGGHLGVSAGATARGSAAGPSDGTSTEVAGGAPARAGAAGGFADAPAGTGGDRAPAPDRVRRRPSFAFAVISITLPVILMLVRAIAELTMKEGTQPRTFLEFIGTPAVALLLAVLLSMFLLGYSTGMTREGVEKAMGSGLPGIAGILLIVAAGGGFKQMLVDAGVGGVIADWAQGSGISTLLLGWLVAVGVRLATGSATVATITAAGIVSGIAADLPTNEVSLLVLAIGCGSLFFSHVNDAGFWLVKEYFGLTVGQTIKSWSVMETAISVVGIICVLLLNLVV